MIDDEPCTDSRKVATLFRKKHSDILRSIRNLNCSKMFRERNFMAVPTVDLTGESTSHILMTKDGFAYLVMGFTGARAAQFKEKYLTKAVDLLPETPDELPEPPPLRTSVEIKRVPRHTRPKTVLTSEKLYAKNIYVNVNKLIPEAEPFKQEYTIPGSNGRSRVDIAIRVKGRLIPVEVKLRARRRDLFQALEYVDLMKSPYGYLITQTDHTGVDFATANNQVRMLVVAGCDKRLV